MWRSRSPPQTAATAAESHSTIQTGATGSTALGNTASAGAASTDVACGAAVGTTGRPNARVRGRRGTGAAWLSDRRGPPRDALRRTARPRGSPRHGAPASFGAPTSASRQTVQSGHGVAGSISAAFVALPASSDKPLSPPAVDRWAHGHRRPQQHGRRPAPGARPGGVDRSPFSAGSLRARGGCAVDARGGTGRASWRSPRPWC